MCKEAGTILERVVSREGLNSYICHMYNTNVSVALWHGVRFSNWKVGSSSPLAGTQARFLFQDFFFFGKWKKLKKIKKFLPQ